jgi:hypothetical protein
MWHTTYRQMLKFSSKGTAVQLFQLFDNVAYGSLLRAVIVQQSFIVKFVLGR